MDGLADKIFESMHRCEIPQGLANVQPWAFIHPGRFRSSARLHDLATRPPHNGMSRSILLQNSLILFLQQSKKRYTLRKKRVIRRTKIYRMLSLPLMARSCIRPLTSAHISPEQGSVSVSVSTESLFRSSPKRCSSEEGT